MGLDPEENPVEVSIAVLEWGAYLGEEGKKNGIRAKVSSWRRISPQSLVPHSKAGGQYLNSVLAKIESKRGGYDEAILLDELGLVCEGSGENIFVVKDGQIATPPQTASILDGISRKSIIEIAADHGHASGGARRRPRRADAGRRGVHGRAPPPSWCRCARSTTSRSARRARSPGEIQQVYEDALHGRDARYAEVARRGACTIEGVSAVLPSELPDAPDGRPGAARPFRLRSQKGAHHHGRRSSSTTPPSATACRARACRSPPTRRCAWRTRSTGSACTSSRRGSPARTPRRRPCSTSWPARRFEHAEIAAFGMTRRRTRPRRTTRGCACWPTASRRCARWWARPGRCTSRRSPAWTPRRTCG